MKKFLAGMLTAVLISALVISAMATSDAFTIEVHPINIQVNGETFTPTDVNGDAVPVFAYNGTTYAPLRALAEAYGLEVGYDAESNMATVTDPDATPTSTPDTTALDFSDWTAEEEAAYQEFKGMWEIEVINTSDTGKSLKANLRGDISVDVLINYLSTNDTDIEKFSCRMIEELRKNYVAQNQNLFVAFSGHGIVLWGGSYNRDFDEVYGGYDVGDYETIEKDILFWQERNS